MNRILLVIILFVFFSCGSERRSNVIYLYSKDKSQVVSIISNYSKNERIIAVGKHFSKPKNNYIELDISKITELNDQFGICWNSNGYKWEMVNDKAKIVTVSLDTTKYFFRESWFKEEGTPNTKYYIKDNCFTVGALDYSKYYPEENGSVERLN
ncbi:hypothetical protein [Flavobacterium sp. FlaQc-30]|uniref:hypothetical protein n=1 Tax=Flavobacterium sp. FlaQc-30 TaxID=3374179 RepID=UPI003756C03B